MNKFLVKYDFETLIKEDNLDEVINDNDRVLTDAMDSAVEKCAGYIRHRYDYDLVFKVVQEYSNSTEFVIGDRVFWSPDAYQETTYALGAIVSYLDAIYECTTAITAPEPFNAAKWGLKAANNTFYTCTADSTANLPTDTDYFSAGDGRNPLIKEIVIDILLYNIHSRIAPRSIPDVRRVRYDGTGNLKEGDSAIATLIQVQKGQVNLNLPVITPDVQNTQRVSFGSSPNNNYNY